MAAKIETCIYSTICSDYNPTVYGCSHGGKCATNFNKFASKKSIHIPFERTVKKYVHLLKLKNFFQKQNWFFSEERLNLIRMEWYNWEKYYLPINVNGKTVLDIGAGEGETACFYLSFGARQVICVEPNVKAFSLLKINAEKHPQIKPINEPFNLTQLRLSHDFLKMDIEGYEEQLLTINHAVPLIVEVHGLQLRDKFLAQNYIAYSEHHGFLSYCNSYVYKNIPVIKNEVSK